MRVSKPIVMMDVKTGGYGGGGGPYTSTKRTMNSELGKKYNFIPLNYDLNLGGKISIRRIKDLVRQLNKTQPDLVHFTGLQLSGLHIAIACKISGIKSTVMTVRGSSADALDINLWKKFILSFILEPITILLCKRVIGVSNYVVSKRIIKVLASKKSCVIYNFPPKSIKNSSDNIDIRNELGLSSSDIVVVSVARITKDKGYHILDEAILNFVNNENIKFVIIGDGDYLNVMRKKLMLQIQNQQVFLLGLRNDVFKILHGCDVFVLPTLHETLSVALLEASQAGIALVASNTGGVPEIVEDDYNGYLVNTGSVKGFTDAINILCANKILRRKFGNNAKYKVSQKFSTKEIVSKIDAVYSSLLDKPVLIA